MKANQMFLWTTLIGVLLYNLLFWEQQWGLNILLFTGFVLGSNFFFFREESQQKAYGLSALCSFLLAIAVVMSNSAFAKCSYSLSMAVTAGFLMQHHYSFPLYGILNTFKKIAYLPANIVNAFERNKDIFPSGHRAGTILKVSIVPLIIVVFFFLIYSSANPTFNSYASEACERIAELFTKMIGYERLLFSLFGLAIILVLTWRLVLPISTRTKWRHNDNMSRSFLKFKSSLKSAWPDSMLKLKEELKTAMICLGLLNLLLLAVNGLDISTVWFASGAESAPAMRMRVHYGTYLLIFSILMAMAVLLYYFRGNLNYISNNRTLKLLAYGWIAQNCILSMTLLIINSRYIYCHGLAYKRLGVLLFLILVAVGLLTVFFKIKDRKTLYYLFKVNTWALLILAVAVSFVNWDYRITEYNLGIADRVAVDWDFLFTEVSDKNLPLLAAGIKEEEKTNHLSATHLQLWTKQIEIRSQQFFHKQANTDIWSWNYADFWVANALSQQKSKHR